MRSLAVPRASYFVASDGQGRVRRPRDVAMAVLGAFLVWWALIGIDSTPDWSQSLIDLVASSPEWVRALFAIGYALSLIYSLVVVGALVFGGRERREALRDLILAVVGTAVLVVLLSFAVNGGWPYVFPEIDLQDPVPRFPVTRVALVTAVLLAVSPHLTKPLRRVGWFAIFITALAAIGLSYGSPIHALGSFGVGMFSAGLLLVIVGSPRGYPDPTSVAGGLAALGVEVTDLSVTDRQTWGVLRFKGTDAQGRPMYVKVHGRDSFDSQLAAKAWRTLWYREVGQTVGYSRLQAVEHEALITVMAERAGVAVPELAAVGSASSELALVAFETGAARLDELAADDLSDELLVHVWGNVRALHDAGMSHGSLASRAVLVSGPESALSDLALGTLAAEDADRASDVVELLYSTAAQVGAERAVRAAVRGLGADAVAGALPYVQVPAVTPPTRRESPTPKKLIAEINEQVVEQTGTEPTEPVKLRRVTGRNLLMSGLLLLMASALIPAFVNVDYAEIWDVLESANWALIVIALIVGHLQFFPSATATMFAVPAKLPFWPLLVLQTASKFVGLAIPSAAGRVAMNAAFLHRFGVSVTVAVAQGAIDGFSGFLVQIAILIVAFITGDYDLGIDTSNVHWVLILGVLAIAIVVVVVAVLKIQKLRERIVPVVSQAWGALMTVLREPTRAIGLLGSNFVYWNLLGLTLWILLQAVGVEISYGSALIVAAGTDLFAGFMPVPGGVGVAEAAMTALLGIFGVDQASAFAVTAVYRVITFYLPAVEGFFGMRWLEANEYI